MTVNRGLALLAGVLAVAAAVAGAPERPEAPGVVELTAELGSGAPLVDAVELGRWIRERRPLRVLDLRDSSSFIRFSIPTAEHVRLAGLRDLGISPDTVVVLYDDGGDDAARAWLLLRRLGHPHVRIVDRGALGWIDRVLNPVLPAGTPEERARYDEVAAVSRYFGGVPRIGAPPARGSGTDAAEEAVKLLSRRGCY